MGKLDPTKSSTRPLKVYLDKENTVHDIIRNAKNPKNSNNLKNVKISLDRTPRQVQNYKNLKNKLDERISNGETDIQIKYIRGIPTIVSLNV